MSSECRKDLRQLLPFVTKSMYLNACWGTRITVGYKALIDGESNLSTDTFWENLSVSVPVGWVVCGKKKTKLVYLAHSLGGSRVSITSALVKVSWQITSYSRGRYHMARQESQ